METGQVKGVLAHPPDREDVKRMEEANERFSQRRYGKRNFTIMCS
jgi:hypothetical protein